MHFILNIKQVQLIPVQTSKLSKFWNSEAPGLLCHRRGEEVWGNHSLRTYPHISAPIHDPTPDMPDPAQGRCAGSATASRRVLLDKVALHMGPCEVSSTYSSSGLQRFLPAATVLAAALTLVGATRRDGSSREVAAEWISLKMPQAQQGSSWHLSTDHVTAVTTAEITMKDDFSL